MDVLKVFISGTQTDLGPERKAVERAVHSIQSLWHCWRSWHGVSANTDEIAIQGALRPILCPGREFYPQKNGSQG
jgi:hypothetical protein